MVSYRWSFETIALSRIIAEILCVKHLAKHIPVKKTIDLIFFVLGGKIGGYSIIVIISLGASLLQLFGPSIVNALLG